MFRIVDPFLHREDVEAELIRLRELEEAAYARLRQEESIVRALQSELEVITTVSIRKFSLGYRLGCG